MADRPRDGTWWLASDGKWYPAHLEPDSTVEAPKPGPPAVTPGSPTNVPARLTRVLAASLGGTSLAFMASAFFGLRFADALGDGSVSPQDLESVEAASLGWSSIALTGFLISGVIAIVWTFKTSKAMDARGPIGRRWRGGWTVGSWFVPLASFVLPKLVFNELEKIGSEPYTRVPLGETWKSRSRSSLGDLWWLLWISGLVTLQVGQILSSDTEIDDAAMSVATSVSTVAYVLLASAGVAMIMVVRRIERDSRR